MAHESMSKAGSQMVAPNGNAPHSGLLPNGDANPSEATKRNRARKKGPNYAQLHSKPLPLSVYPLPAFHPTHPLSLLRLAYAYLSQLLAPPTSHTETFSGHFSPDTRSVHITDFGHVRALWEMGFFGKGTLSRSEPSWLAREQAQLRSRRSGGRTAEEATNARREERRRFKLERARAEREKVERQRMVERGLLDAAALNADGDAEAAGGGAVAEVGLAPGAEAVMATTDPTMPLLAVEQAAAASEDDDDDDNNDELLPEVENEEHLQLSMEEAFFLSYGLGVLRVAGLANVVSSESTRLLSNPELLELFCMHSFFPPRSPSLPFAPDDQFLLNYVTYHHFRSLGWVIRSGVKFAVDYLLYNRGPVFAHAEFAIVIWPSYSDPYWSTDEGQMRRRLKTERDWWWLHCVNRVQSQVRKSLVIVYVDVPAVQGSFDGDIGRLLKRYTVREFVVKRWLANRSRD